MVVATLTESRSEMGRNAEWLSDKQVGALEWVRSGCPSDESEVDVERRIVARSLHRRGLITIKGRGETWAASITEAGLAWQATHRVAKVDQAEADDLIRRVVTASGRLELPGGAHAEAGHKELVRRSNHSPNRPKGWRLELKTTGRWDDPRQEVILVRHFEDLVELEPVPVPNRVTPLSPAGPSVPGRS